MRRLIFLPLLFLCVYCFGLTTVTRYVNTGSTAGGDGTTNATTGANRAYASLNEAEGNNRDCVANDEAWVINCTGTTADTKAVVVAGWTVDGTRKITLNGNNTSGKWDTSKYRIDLTGINGLPLDIQISSVTINDFQIRKGQSGTTPCLQVNNANSNKNSNNIINRCVLRGTINNGTWNQYGVWLNACGGNNVIQNCLIYDFNDTSVNTDKAGVFSYFVTATNYVYNCTVSSCAIGIKFSGGTAPILKNNICYNNSIDYNGTMNSASTNNLSKDQTAPAFNTYYRGKSLTFTDILNRDFSLVSTDTDAIGKGVDMSASYTTDLKGVSWGGVYDLGCLKYVSASTPLIKIFPDVHIME